MPDYLPLCAFRQGLLPVQCRCCAWWQTTGTPHMGSQAGAFKRRQWMTALEGTWGTTGLLLEAGVSGVRTLALKGTSQAKDGPASEAAAPNIVASINFAPSPSLPRLREFKFGPVPDASALLFCLTVDDDQPRSQSKRILSKALAQLKTRGVEEVYAVAKSSAGPDALPACRFFSVEFLATNGFQEVAVDSAFVLMRVDLRGLLSLVDRVETAVKRILNGEPTPSPAAWTHRGA